MMKPAVAVALFAVPLLATSASADTVTTEADTLVVVTPNAPVVVQQGGGGPQTVAPSAAPGTAVMPPSAAPQNEDWNNVSHINGTPVKVGERGAYLHQFRKTNISGNPFGPFFGYYDLAVSHAISQNLAASVAVSGWDMDDGDSSGYQVSATLPLYFRRAFSGPFLEGGLLMRVDTSSDYDAYGYDYGYEMEESSWIGPQLLFGWHSTFDSGLNVSLAFGVAKRVGGNDQTEGNGYFRVGYAF